MFDTLTLKLSFILCFLSCFTVSVLSMYCERENCYDLLKVTRSSSKSEISKSYRVLAKEYHPDRHKSQEDKDKYGKLFMQIAQAYEVLKDEETRKEYDYMLDHPDEYYRNHYYYYRRRYSPKMDVRIVIAVIIAIISLIQYLTAWQKYNEVLNYFLTIPKYRIKAKEIAENQGLLSDLYGPSAKRLNRQKNLKMSKEDMKSEEERILKKIIREQMDVKGAYAKPEWTDLIVVKLVLLPYSLYEYLNWYARWIYKFDYLKLEYGMEEKLYLIRKFMKMSQCQFDQFTEEEKEEYLEQTLWIKTNFDEWKKVKDEEAKKKLLQSGKYKNYKRWMRKGGPGQISFVEDE
ncbi:unnamed protein product [Gordionus sp. m RMFG-2023]|uniref:dnaJ homolog subfamily C member 25-like n=1 Tax=Gordionus sp. m RMFG-2023 TaxID=3053472 RepID=UPI0030E20B78